MLSKKFINKCLFYLNNACRYTNVSYSLSIDSNNISIFVHIWASNKRHIITTHHYTIKDEDDFNKFSTDVVDFIKENKEYIK